jgi:hypothetical protein
LKLDKKANYKKRARSCLPGTDKKKERRVTTNPNGQLLPGCTTLATQAYKAGYGSAKNLRFRFPCSTR